MSNPDEDFFKEQSRALALWRRKYNTAEIAKIMHVAEHVVERWIWNWRELSRS